VVGRPSSRGALLSVGDRQLGPEASVVLAQPLVLGAQRREPLAERRFRCALTSRDAVGLRRRPMAQALDLGAQRGLGVEPLARDAGAARDRLEADRRASARCARSTARRWRSAAARLSGSAGIAALQ
jgi:hypothetical protein